MTAFSPALYWDCEQCGGTFERAKSDAKNSNWFCSQVCQDDYYANCVENHCGECGEYESECTCEEDDKAGAARKAAAKPGGTP